MREHRGDGHVAALAAADVGPVEANVLTELWVGYPLGEYAATRGHSPEVVAAAVDGLRQRGWIDGDRLSTTGQEVRDGIESVTDASQAELGAAFGDRIDWATRTAARFSASIIGAGGFTDDARKRAAG